MKKKLLMAFCTAIAIFTGCGSSEEKSLTQYTPQLNPYISAFTSGKVSKQSNIYIVFSQDIPKEKMMNEQIKKFIKIKPAINGNWSFQDEHTIVFSPETEFARNTSYKVSVNLEEWFEADGNDRKFEFSFSTLPFALKAIFESLNVDEDDDGKYIAEITILTPDCENPMDVENIVDFSEKADVTWEHEQNGTSHKLTISNLTAKDEKRLFKIRTGKNNYGISRDEIISFEIPNKNDFTIYDIKYISQPEQYIEVSFTDILDQDQDMHGLAYIDGNSSETVTVKGNKLRLYPDPQQTNTVTVNISPAIRNRKGKTLGQNLSYKVEIQTAAPNVKFIGNGVIIPLSDNLTIPFQAIYLRGVTVRVIQIMGKNMGQFFQINNYDGNAEMMRVGRIIARKTIFFDAQGANLEHWNNYAINLSELIEPQPGAIYRIELSFNKDLSAFPCDESQQKTKEQIAAEDQIKLQEELNRFNEGGYYYYYDEYDDWENYNYNERNNPCSSSYYYNRTIGRNVIATNLGLIATIGEENSVNVMVHDILTTEPVKGVNVAAYNYQNQKIGTDLTDNKGMAKIDFGINRPYYIIASLDKQRSYLKIDQGSALSLSSFDVAGEMVQKGLKGFIYGERGVWRPGDVIHLAFMLNDRDGKLPKNHPVTMQLYTPLGQLYAKKTQTINELGLYTFDFPTEDDAQTGAWSVTATVGGASFSKTVRVEAIKPNRLKIEFDTPDTILLRNKPSQIKMHSEWLQGAIARNLKYEIETSFSRTETKFKNFDEFVFDDPSKEFNNPDPNITSGKTDQDGNATINLKFDIGDNAPGMLSANMMARVYEESGDFSIDAFSMAYSPYTEYAGIKSPQKGLDQLNTGTNNRFEIATVDYKGNVLPNKTVDVEVYKVEWYWWWSAAGQRLANYIANSYNKPVKNMSLQTDRNGKAVFDLNFPNNEWGTYFIRVKNNNGQSAGIMAYFDWPSMYGRRNTDGSDAPTTIVIKTDKETYAPGEKITVTFPSTEQSRAILSIENGTSVISTSEYLCSSKETTITIDATEEMQPNAYIYITLLQPHGATINDLPIRMYGVVPITVTSPQSHLTPVIQTPDEIRPESNYSITVSEQNGREMAYTLAVVDEGLLDLTRFKTPDPWSAFNAREALGVSTWDLYNYVVGAYGGRIEQVFSIGGDTELIGTAKAIVNRFTPVVVFDGPFLLKKGEVKKHSFDMPNYSGRVRIMVVAGNGKAYGNAQKSILVRKPLMILGTLPRIIGTNEEMIVPATIFAMKEGLGDVKVNIEVSDNIEISGNKSQTLNFSKTEDKQALFRIKTKGNPGTGSIKITASAGNESAEYSTNIEIRSVQLAQTVSQTVTLQPGGQWSGNIKMPGKDGTNSLTLEVSDLQPLNLSSRLDYLIGYPHGCLEQIISKAFPQLYLKEFASLNDAQAQSADDAIKETIQRLRSFQTPEGRFAYWPGSSNYYDWASAYATHFLIEAEKHGYFIPEELKNNAISALRRSARNWKVENSEFLNSEYLTQAYRLYLLSITGSPETGAMNRLRESNLDNTSRWLAGAAYAIAGFQDAANDIIAKTTAFNDNNSEYDLTFGSNLRNMAIKLITLTLMDKSDEAATIANEISKQLASDQWYSTQTTAFALIALSQYIDKYQAAESMNFSYETDGQKNTISTQKHIWSMKLKDNASEQTSLTLENQGDATIFARIITEGIPEQGNEKAYANRINIKVSYKDRNGNEIDAAALPQGTNFTASVTVENPSAMNYDNIALSQIFPAGWEILNTRFIFDETGTDKNTGIDYQDIRDDRVYTYINHLPSGAKVTTNINLAAVYPGRFYLPPTSCEAMYDHSVRANTEGTYVTVE